jgi:NADH:ubiquinone reductase (H+-translocating)
MAPGAPDHRVVVIGGGFGGLQLVKHLRSGPFAVTLIDRRNFHLFQPLTYQVATGSLSPSDVSYPLRALFGSAPNVRVMLAEVTGFDLERRRVLLAGGPGTGDPAPVPYDTLVVAAGSSYSYFGHDEWREFAGEVKTLESALSVRARVLTALERAEIATEAADRRADLTFVVVGGGPTGVEIAGQIGELTRDTMARDFARLDPGQVRILLVEMADRLLGAFPESLSAKATKSLGKLGVTARLGQTVVGIDADGVSLKSGDGAVERVPSRAVVWAAGVRASDLAAKLAEQIGADVDKAGRVTVERDLTLPGHSEVFAIGDMATVTDGHGGVLGLPGLAPVAIQQAQYVAKLLQRRRRDATSRPFKYLDKGNLATIGRGRAVADIGPLHLSGVPAWLIWLVVHIWYLIGFQNRLMVMLRWSISFLSRGRLESSRIIEGVPCEPHREAS